MTTKFNNFIKDAITNKEALNAPLPAHTPGPWLSNSGLIMAGATNESIATVKGSFGCPIMNANARLIASAPELLNEIENIIEAFDSEMECTEILDMLGKNASVRAAIAKATGE